MFEKNKENNKFWYLYLLIEGLCQAKRTAKHSKYLKYCVYQYSNYSDTCMAVKIKAIHTYINNISKNAVELLQFLLSIK